MKLDDIIALAKQGYKVNDIKELIALSKDDPKDDPKDEQSFKVNANVKGVHHLSVALEDGAGEVDWISFK